MRGWRSPVAARGQGSGPRIVDRQSLRQPRVRFHTLAPGEGEAGRGPSSPIQRRRTVRDVPISEDRTDNRFPARGLQTLFR